MSALQPARPRPQEPHEPPLLPFTPQPRTAVCGAIDLIRTTDLSAEQRAYIDVVEHGAGQVLSLVEDLMDTQEGARDAPPARFRSNPTVCHPRRDIVDLAWASIRLQKRYADKVRALHMRLEVQEQPPLPELAIVDAGRARQVLTNLLGCAPLFSGIFLLLPPPLVLPSRPWFSLTWAIISRLRATGTL